MQIAIVGCGNMGVIYARAFLKYNLVQPHSLWLVEKNEERKKALAELQSGKVITPDELDSVTPDVIILAVKPQDFPSVIPSLAGKIPSSSVVISIMGGITIPRLQAALQTNRIIRAMPNAPAELGMGITGYTASPELSLSDLHRAEQLLSATGRAVYFEKEAMLDAVTAISGSGPAYFYYFVSSMIRAACEMGMDEATASLLVKQTMLGSFHVLNSSSQSLDELIQVVASRGGTTEAAIAHMNTHGVNRHIAEALKKAEKRAQELSEFC